MEKDFLPRRSDAQRPRQAHQPDCAIGLKIRFAKAVDIQMSAASFFITPGRRGASPFCAYVINRFDSMTIILSIPTCV